MTPVPKNGGPSGPECRHPPSERKHMTSTSLSISALSKQISGSWEQKAISICYHVATEFFSLCIICLIMFYTQNKIQNRVKLVSLLWSEQLEVHKITCEKDHISIIFYFPQTESISEAVFAG